MVLRRDFRVANGAALLIALIAVVTPGDIVAGQDASKPSLASRPSPNFWAQPRFVPQPNVEHYAPYSVTIEAKGNSNDGVPLVTGIVNSRVPSAPVTLSVRVEPDAPGNTVVHWSSPDGKNELGSDFHVVGSSDLKWDEPLLGNAVGVFPHGDASGKAIIVAEVGPPVNARATISIVDGIGIGFGCYGFMPQGQSVRFVDGIPKASTLSDADVAVIGPAAIGQAPDGSKVSLGPGPWYGCWGENVDAAAREYGLRFKYGGRVEGGAFSQYLPYKLVAGARILDVRSEVGATYRLHVSGGAGTYFTGWVEPLTRALSLRAVEAFTTRSCPNLGSVSRNTRMSIRAAIGITSTSTVAPTLLNILKRQTDRVNRGLLASLKMQRWSRRRRASLFGLTAMISRG